MTSTKPNPPIVQPHDRVTLDGGTTEYVVGRLSQDGMDVYVSFDEDRNGGSWVDIRSITTINGKAVR